LVFASCETSDDAGYHARSLDKSFLALPARKDRSG
jgi:hypothetical protein